MASRQRWATLAASVLATLTGCASIPASSAVHVIGSPAPGNVAGPALKVIAQPPTAGESAADVVRGFIAAAADPTGNHQVAREYLTRSAAATWNDRAGAQVYDESALSIPRAPVRGTLVVSAPLVATVDARGDYTPEAAQVASWSLPVVRDGGQWRIAAAPPGLLLSQVEFNLTYKPVDVYFLDPTDRVLVPDPLVIQVNSPEALPTLLVSALLAGPSAGLGSAIHSAAPIGTRLEGPVTFVGGIGGGADVNLSPQLLAAGAGQLRAFAAQLAYTLRNLATSVRVTVGGDRIPGLGPAVSANTFPSFDPAVVHQESGYAVINGTLRALTGDHAVVPGSAGLSSPAVSADGQYVAGLMPGPHGTTTLMEVTPRGGPHPVFTEPAILPPSFGNGDVLWTAVTSTTGAQSVVQVTPAGQIRSVSAPALQPLGTVTSIAVSRDGTRVAVVANDRLYIGPVDQSPAGPQLNTLGSPAPVANAIASAVAWRDARTVVVVERVTPPPSAGHVQAIGQPLQVAIDGSTQDSLATAGLPAGIPTEVAAGPGPSGGVLLAVGGAIYELAGDGWRRVVAGTDPAFPGG